MAVKTVAVETDNQDVQRPWDEGAPLTDWSAFPQCYALLLNQRLACPQNMSLWRMKIDTTRQLFVDDYLIGHMANLKRTCHEAKDHPANPLMPGGWCHYFAPDPEHGLRMYYMGKGSTQSVAFSSDGLNWERPELNVFDLSTIPAESFAGGPNNVVCNQQMHGMFHEPDDPDPLQRWKAIVRTTKGRPTWPHAQEEFGISEIQAYVLITSPDGLRWSYKQDTCLVTSGGPVGINYRAPYQLPIGVGDVLQVQRDPKAGKYIANVKGTIGPDLRLTDVYHCGRSIAMCESDDLIHWSTPRYYAYPDTVDAKTPGMYGVYEANAFPYESMWFNCLSMTSYDPATPEIRREKNLEPNRPYLKRNWIRPAASRDGRHFYYFGDRTSLISPGDDGSWKPHYLRVANMVNIGGPLVKDDELWFYHLGNSIDGPKRTWNIAFGVATLRRDGFASLDAGDEPGVVITRPMVFEGEGKLFVNVDVAANGHARASVIEESGEPIDGFGEEDCVAVTDDKTRAALHWKSNQTLAPLKDRYVRVAFHLNNARLYAFWIE